MDCVRVGGVVSVVVIAATACALSSCGSAAGPGVTRPTPSTVSGTPGGGTAAKTGGLGATPSTGSASASPAGVSPGPATVTPSLSVSADPQNPLDLRRPTPRPTGSSH
jgi:hypothetical protein